MGNLSYYIFCLIGLIVAVLIFKKVAGCLIKSIIMAVIVGVLVALYFMFFK